MSLVNQMLRDLEARHAPERGGEAVLQDLSVSAAGSQRAISGAVYLVIGMVLAGVAILGGWYWMQQNERAFPVPMRAEAVQEPVTLQQRSPTPEPMEDVVRQEVKQAISVTPPSVVIEESKRQRTNSAIAENEPEKKNPKITIAPPQKQAVVEPAIESAPVDRSKPVVPTPPPPKKPVLERIDRPRSRGEVAQAEFLKGTDLIAKGRINAAHAAFTKALELDPNHLQAREVWVALLLRGGETDRAERLLREGLKLQPKAFSLARMLARLLAERGAVTQALGVLERTVPPVTADPDFYGLLAALYQRSEQHARAVAAYRRVLAIVPDKAVWWMGMGISLEKLQRQDEAVQAYRRARATGGMSSQVNGYINSRLAALAGNGQ